MLLVGTYPRTLDEKKRLTLPKRAREQLRDTHELFVTLDPPDRCLLLYAQAEFERLWNRVEDSPGPEKEVKVFRRLFAADTDVVDVDRSGRILMPERLLQLAGLKHEVVMIGTFDHLELWDAQRWQEYLGENAPRFAAVAEKAFQKR